MENGEKRIWKWLTGVLVAVLMAMSGVLWAVSQEAIESNTEVIRETLTKMQQFERRITQCEVNYRNIIDLLWEVRGDVKELRKEMP